MKKLELNKNTVSNLNDEQMDKIHGATLAYTSCNCNTTNSCTGYVNCCPPPERAVNKFNLD
ncbi:MAG: class I lanthipeptide [Candidatus Aminicenantes bacterium]|nr:class I lanthipeptide [Candidatus Aminicenantes bacterium]